MRYNGGYGNKKANQASSARQRYLDKLLEIHGVDPQDIPQKSWSNNHDDLPEVNYARIVQYFVLGKSAYTAQEFAAYKSLSAYKTFPKKGKSDSELVN